MPIYLDENMMGADTSVIGFPHLLLCMGVVCATDEKLFGIHLTDVGDAQKVMPHFATWLGAQGVGTNDIRTIYTSANMAVRYGKDISVTTRIARRREELGALGNTLGYKGKIYFFDGSIIVPKDGYYAEFRAKHTTNRCRIFYKRNEKMVYTTTLSGQGALPETRLVVVGSTTPSRVRRDGTIDPEIVIPDKLQNINRATTVAVGKRSGFHSGVPHELDYANRLISITV
jgi:hypothetical protein